MKTFKKRFGIVGTSQYAHGDVPPPDSENWVEIQDERPSLDHQLQPGLTWALSDLKKWEREMEEVERNTGLPRWFEDHLVDDHGGKTNNPYLQAKLDEKLAKRAEKPK